MCHLHAADPRFIWHFCRFVTHCHVLLHTVLQVYYNIYGTIWKLSFINQHKRKNLIYILLVCYVTGKCMAPLHCQHFGAIWIKTIKNNIYFISVYVIGKCMATLHYLRLSTSRQSYCGFKILVQLLYPKWNHCKFWSVLSCVWMKFLTKDISADSSELSMNDFSCLRRCRIFRCRQD